MAGYMDSFRGRYLTRLLVGIGLFLATSPCSALEPDEVLVLANRNASGSVGLAQYYMARRGIPEKNLFKIWVPDKETISREEYDTKVAKPVRKFINQIKAAGRIRCIAIMYGIPLRVAPPRLSPEENVRLKGLQQRREELQDSIKKNENPKGSKHSAFMAKLQGVKNNIRALTSDRNQKQGASVDSELMLVAADSYSLTGWTPNPYFLGNRDQKLPVAKEHVLMASRLDGPSEDLVRRMIDASMTAEEKGLSGKAYFDARWQQAEKKDLKGYAFYDQSIHNAANRVKSSGLMPVRIDDKETLFQQGDCTEAALYCGWYSLANYVDAFDWVPGAVGYHIASGECQTLKRAGFRGWCKMMLEDGVAVTVGPVGEPYVQAFPVPEIFFGFLTDGYLSLAECYLISTPFLSWKMVLIGDPLYRPFKSRIQSTGGPTQ